MTRSPLRRAISFAAFALFIPAALIGCPKKAAPVEDAGAPPPASTPSVTELAPLVEEAGPDAAPEAAPKKWGGGGYNSNQLKIKECCNAMRAQAKQMGNSPEMTAAAMQCDAIAAQVGPSGTAPEFAQLRAILKSIKLPSACQF
jgi:hypothetical protein